MERRGWYDYGGVLDSTPNLIIPSSLRQPLGFQKDRINT